MKRILRRLQQWRARRRMLRDPEFHALQCYYEDLLKRAADDDRARQLTRPFSI
jgi:hypothetical protein